MNAESTILLVDESRFFLTIESQFLRKAPVRILEAGSGEEALQLCRSEKPHLVYMAFDLAGQSGAECCRLIKQDAELQSIPVILVCNENAEHEVETSNLAGCDAVLTKPLDRRRFLEIGRSFLAGVREMRRTCLISVRVVCGDRQFSTKGLDLSSGGVFLETGEDLAPGTELELEMHLARPGETGPRIQCGGQVAWLNTPDNPTKPHHPVGLGVKFMAIPAQAASVLNGFLRTMERGGQPS